MQAFPFLRVPIALPSRAELREIIAQELQNDSFCHIATVNPEFLVEAKDNDRFRKILKGTSFNVCDGVGISILGRILHGQKIERIPGVELAEVICEEASKTGKSVFFLGGFGVAGDAGEAMKQKFPGLQVAGSLDGDETTFEEVKRTNPDVVLVAFGAPKQEYWLDEYGKNIPSLKIGIGVGGTFDFWAGKVPRAPHIMQKLGLEWLYRLITEPRKRAKRIWNAVIVFPILAVKEKFSS